MAVVRGTLLVCLVLNVWAAVALTLENKKARPADYGFKHTIQATLASRTMRMTGFVVLAFVIYHLLHFTIGTSSAFFQGETYKSAVKLTFPKGASLKDPAGLFNASLEGKTRRAIDLHEGEPIDERAFKALIRAAVALNASR